MSEKVTAKDAILRRLFEASKPLAVHELDVFGVSDNAAATRLSELAKEGKVTGTIRRGTRYKEWSIPRPGQGELFQ